MIKTFYGNFLRERFPYKGKIRSEEDSAGARLLNALGSEIEENYRRKISGKECFTLSSSDHAVKELGNLYAYDMTEYANYNQEVLSERIRSIEVSDSDRVESLEELFNGLPETFSYVSGNDKVSKDPLLFENIKRETSANTFLKTPGYIYVNVKSIGSVFQKVLNEKSGIILRGYDENMYPIEEFIEINSSKMYRTKQKFRSLENLAQDLEKNISGGNALSVVSLKSFEIDILAENCKSWRDKDDYRLLENGEPIVSKVKRIELPGLISKPKLDRIFFNNSVTDNDLLIEASVFTHEGEVRSKLKFVHRFFNEIDEYAKDTNSSVIEEDIFEQVIGEVELVDETDSSVEIIDLDYDPKTGKVFILSTGNQLLAYEPGMPICEAFKMQRTFNPGMRIDLLDTEYLRGESLDVRIINSSLDLPVSNFIVGKIENDEVKFLNESKGAFESNAHVFNPVVAEEDLQNTIGNFSFSLEVVASDIEVFTLCFKDSSKNSNALETISQSPGLSVTSLINLFDIEHLNVRKITCSKIQPTKTYSDIISPNVSIKNMYFEGVLNSLWFVDEQNHHYKYIAEHNKAFFTGHTLYRTEPSAVDFTVSFELFSGGNPIEVSVNA